MQPTPLLLLIDTKDWSLFQIGICLLWRQTPLIKDVLHPASYTVDHLLSGVQTHAILKLCTCYTISGFGECANSHIETHLSTAFAYV